MRVTHFMFFLPRKMGATVEHASLTTSHPQPLCVEVRPRSTLRATAGAKSNTDPFGPAGERPDVLSPSARLIYCLKTKCMHLYKATFSPQVHAGK